MWNVDGELGRDARFEVLSKCDRIQRWDPHEGVSPPVQHMDRVDGIGPQTWR